VKAAPADQLRLLEVQDADLALDQLAHRRRTLPEHAEITRLAEELRGLRDEVTRAETTADDLDRQIRRLEADVDQVRQRAARNRQRMDSGAVSAKDLESLQHELATLARRQSELEDVELDLMQQREDAGTAVAEARRRVEASAAALADAEKRRDAAYAEIDAQVAERAGEREKLVIGLPGELLELYERIRTASGGIGAARLRGRRCEGCRIELFGTALAEVKAAPEDQVLRHDECRRILVRTPESGL